MQVFDECIIPREKKIRCNKYTSNMVAFTIIDRMAPLSFHVQGGSKLALAFAERGKPEVLHRPRNLDINSSIPEKQVAEMDAGRFSNKQTRQINSS